MVLGSKKRIRKSKNKILPFLLFGILFFTFVNCKLPISLSPKVSLPLIRGIDTLEIQRFSVDNPNNENLTYYTYLPDTVNNSMQILFVMHGKDRNAMDYLDAWKDFADSNNFLIIAPEFPELISGETFDYQEGNIWNKNHQWNEKKDWAFATIERIFDDVKQNNALVADSFYIFGHSAGAQFVHRMITFMPESSAKVAIAANAGWYTFPNFKETFPYGLNEAPLSTDSLKLILSKKLFILLGENDTKKGFLRETEKANKQGNDRLERGENYYKAGKNEAYSLNCKFNWKINIIDDADHNYIIMSKAAQEIILNL